MLNNKTVYSASLIAATDYYPFGMPMPTRNYTGGSYRFGYNGKEYDKEWQNADAVVYDYGFRIYDARISRFLSVDPLTKSYPYLTTYAFAENSVLNGIDLDGAEWVLKIYSTYYSGKFINAYTSNDIYRMREVTYKALNIPLEKEHLEWQKQQRIDGNIPQDAKQFPSAVLTYDKSAPNGVTVYCSQYENSGNKEFSMTFNTGTLFSPDLSTEYYDRNYPVDIRLKDNPNPKNDWEGSWKDFYAGYDIIGTQTGGNLNFGENHEASLFQGYMRGFGFIQLGFTDIGGAATPAAGASFGSVMGNYVGVDGKFGANPLSITGAGSETTFGYGSFAAGFWKGFSEPGKISWQGSVYYAGGTISGNIFSTIPLSRLIPNLRIGMQTNTTLLFPKPKE